MRAIDLEVNSLVANWKHLERRQRRCCRVLATFLAHAAMRELSATGRVQTAFAATTDGRPPALPEIVDVHVRVRKGAKCKYAVLHVPFSQSVS
jgi:hypothetical protein